MVKNIRVGNDLVNITRFKKALSTGQFKNKIFHQIEIDYCEQKGDKALESFAARFAAKEAFSKALGTGLFSNGITPKDIWIENLENGCPVLNFTEKIKKHLEENTFSSCSVSLSHHEEYALATVIIY